MSVKIIDCSSSKECDTNTGLIITVKDGDSVVQKCKATRKNNTIILRCEFSGEWQEDVILSLISFSKKHNCSIWGYVPIESESVVENLLCLARHSFSYPYVCRITPENVSIPVSLALTWKEELDSSESNSSKEGLTSSKDNVNPSNSSNAIHYALQQYEKDECDMNVFFDEETLQYLKEATNKGWQKNSQKEMTGNLFLKEIVLQNDKIIHIISLDKSSVTLGHEESVSVKSSKYNFHSHPKQAYERHNVDKAWPSLTDYNGYLTLGNRTLFHLVTTIEGLYLICFGTYWANNLSSKNKKRIRKFLKDNYDISRKTNMTPQECVSHINDIKFEGHPIFLLSFQTWREDISPFVVKFPKSEDNCFPCEQTEKAFKESISSGEERDVT